MNTTSPAPLEQERVNQRISMLLNFPMQVTTADICRASEEQMQVWLEIVASVVTNVPGHQFADYFPRDAVNAYRDSRGCPLLGYRRSYDLHRKELAWRIVSADDSHVTASEQQDYLRYCAIPVFCNVLLHGLACLPRTVAADEQRDAAAFFAELDQIMHGPEVSKTIHSVSPEQIS